MRQAKYLLEPKSKVIRYKMCNTCGKIKPSQCFFSVHQSKVRSPQCRRCQLGKFDDDFKPTVPFEYPVFTNFMADLDALHARFEQRMERITKKFHKAKKVVEKRNAL